MLQKKNKKQNAQSFISKREVIDCDYLCLCWQWWGWRPSTQLSHRCWLRWRERYQSPDHSLFAEAHPAARQSDQQQRATERETMFVGDPDILFCIFYTWKCFYFPYLNNDKQANPSTHLRGVSIHASHDVHNCLPNGDDHSKHCKRNIWFISGNILKIT